MCDADGQRLDLDTGGNTIMTKILVVEDESDIRELLVDILGDCGYDVVQAGDGGAALAVVNQERPDIILLDVMMPVMDGFQVLKLLNISGVEVVSMVLRELTTCRLWLRIGEEMSRLTSTPLALGLPSHGPCFFEPFFGSPAADHGRRSGLCPGVRYRPGEALRPVVNVQQEDSSRWRVWKLFSWPMC